MSAKGAGSPAEFLNYSPRPGAIFFVIARPLIHDLMPVLMPIRRFLIVEP